MLLVRVCVYVYVLVVMVVVCGGGGGGGLFYALAIWCTQADAKWGSCQAKVRW